MQAILIGVLMALVGLIISLFLGNIVIFLLLQDIPWWRLFKGYHAVDAIRNLYYSDLDRDPKHRLDLYLPRAHKGFPTVHFVHGGYWNSGDKDYYRSITGLYDSVGIALARHGIGCVIQNYRLSPDADYPAQLDDVIAGIKWTAEHVSAYGGDPERIFLMGHSAGGQFVSFLAADHGRLQRAGVDMKNVRGCIALSGIYDLKDMAAKNGDSFNEHVTWRVFGRGHDALVKYSPMHAFRAGMPRMLMCIGSKDFPYLQQQGVVAAEWLSSLGERPKYVVVPEYNHMDMVLKFGRKEDPIIAEVVKFVAGPRSARPRKR